jgi:hypothetical protein
MHTRQRLFLVTGLAVVLAAREAHGEIYHLKSPSTLETEKGSKLSLPPGYFLDEETWRERDLEMKRLQEQEVRLGAENLSLRRSADEFPWLAVGGAGVIGTVLGIILISTQ